MMAAQVSLKQADFSELGDCPLGAVEYDGEPHAGVSLSSIMMMKQRHQHPTEADV